MKCTAVDPLEDLGLGTAEVPDDARGKRDFWFERIHRDYNLAIQMDESMEGYGLKWGNGSVCEWPDAEVPSLAEGRIPFIGDSYCNGHDGRLVSEKGVPIDSHGLLRLTNFGTGKTPDVQFPVYFNSSMIRVFANYAELKTTVEGEFHKSNRDAIEPLLFDLNYAIRMIERYGQRLENLVYFRKKNHLDSAEHSIAIENNTLVVPGRLDSCECQQLLKCPNGTSVGINAESLEDCKKNEGEVIRRYSLIPS
eukprot:8811151-Ditylum_brightwellii.AAC.1